MSKINTRVFYLPYAPHLPLELEDCVKTLLLLKGNFGKIVSESFHFVSCGNARSIALLWIFIVQP